MGYVQVQEPRRCRFPYSTSTAYLRVPTSPASTGVDFWKKWMEGFSSAAMEAKKINVRFDKAGPLGIKLDAVRMVEYVEDSGLAYGFDIMPGDRLIEVGGKTVKGFSWEQLVDLLSRRPVALTFVRGGPVESMEERTPRPSFGEVGPKEALLGAPQEQTSDDEQVSKDDEQVSKDTPSSPKQRADKAKSCGRGSASGSGSRRRFSAPPPRRSRSSKCPRQRWSLPAQRPRNSSAAGSAAQAEKMTEAAGPELLDSSLATVVPANGLQVDKKTLPRPPCSQCWDWPLTRNEKKARILLIDKQVLLMDRETMQSELDVLRSLDVDWCANA